MHNKISCPKAGKLVLQVQNQADVTTGLKIHNYKV